MTNETRPNHKVAVSEMRRRGVGRQLLLQKALGLFAERGVDRTSLQAIADEMGVTKAAVYYHYKTKDDIVLGVLEGALGELDLLITKAEEFTSHRIRVETIIDGLADLVVRNRTTYKVLIGDRSVTRLLDDYAPSRGIFKRLESTLLGLNPDVQSYVNVAMFQSALIGPAEDPACDVIEGSILRRILSDVGRRILLTQCMH